MFGWCSLEPKEKRRHKHTWLLWIYWSSDTVETKHISCVVCLFSGVFYVYIVLFISIMLVNNTV